MAKRVLIVDDSPTVRAVVKVHLIGREFEFVEADSGERALSLARLLPVDLIIVDVNMHGMDGITFVSTLRKDPRTNVRNTPVILLTGDKSEGLRQRGLDAGANGFVNKPVSESGLREAIDRLFKEPRR